MSRRRDGLRNVCCRLRPRRAVHVLRADKRVGECRKMQRCHTWLLWQRCRGPRKQAQEERPEPGLAQLQRDCQQQGDAGLLHCCRACCTYITLVMELQHI